MKDGGGEIDSHKIVRQRQRKTRCGKNAFFVETSLNVYYPSINSLLVGTMLKARKYHKTLFEWMDAG